MSENAALESLAELREEIDRIDGEMHRLLMDRGEIIDRLIAVKARQGGGSAFRPGREADMMRVIAERHHGRLPLETVESIWRVIISTFTYVQSNYAVHADMSGGGDTAMRDSARFHFGFTVPLIVHASAAARRSRPSPSRRGRTAAAISACCMRSAGRRWSDGGSSSRTKTPQKSSPACPSSNGRTIRRGRRFSSFPIRSRKPRRAMSRFFPRDGLGPGPDDASFRAVNCECLARAKVDGGVSMLVSAPGDWSAEKLAAALKLAPGAATWIGSHAERFSLS